MSSPSLSLVYNTQPIRYSPTTEKKHKLFWEAVVRAAEPGIKPNSAAVIWNNTVHAKFKVARRLWLRTPFSQSITENVLGADTAGTYMGEPASPGERRREP